MGLCMEIRGQLGASFFKSHPSWLLLFPFAVHVRMSVSVEILSVNAILSVSAQGHWCVESGGGPCVLLCHSLPCCLNTACRVDDPHTPLIVLSLRQKVLKLQALATFLHVFWGFELRSLCLCS